MGGISTLCSGQATIDAAIAVRSELLKDVECKQHELSEVHSKLEVARLETRKICQRIISPQWTTSVRVNDTLGTLVSLRDEFDFVLARVSQVQSLVAINEETPLLALQVDIASASAAFKEGLSASQSETTSSRKLVELTQTVADGTLALQKAKGEAKSLRKAVDVLGALLSESSLEKASQEALSAIGGQINEVFSRIHAPREYEYLGKPGALLRSVATLEARTLEQVSTGQRAAFALSIFLALNRTARSAPPVLLIDDSIAHIDDLNALSFLDYIRDLAVSSGRQIFFAAADARIASLFSKKFSFLGEEFKTIPLTRTLIA